MKYKGHDSIKFKTSFSANCIINKVNIFIKKPIAKQSITVYNLKKYLQIMVNNLSIQTVNMTKKEYRSGQWM